MYSMREETCFSSNKIHWPFDDQCYELLEQGPCSNGEWLVATKFLSQIDFKLHIKVSCKPRICPCLDTEPYLCEVQLENTSQTPNNCRNCIVALAAEQNGICRKGEQLLVSPFGYGICGCRVEPILHVVWPLDGNCYPLHQRGQPCQKNETLHWDPKSKEPICVPALCPLGFVLSIEDGGCHVLDTQGK